MSQNKVQRVPKTKADLERELVDQVSLLLASCKNYDNGLKAAGKHIALSLRVLLHHHKSSKALLEQLGLRSRRFYDTAGRINEANLMSSHNLVFLHFGPQGAEYVPLCLGGPPPIHPRRVLFAEWWNQAVIKDQKRRKFNRRELVMHVADTDGGAHVDPALDEAYMDLSRQNSIGWVITTKDGERPMTGIELACMRQIGHEVLITLRHSCPTAFAEPYDLAQPT